MAFQPPPRQAVDAGFVETIRQLLGTDNNARNVAEQRYDSAKRTEPVQLVASLVQVLLKSDIEVPVREQCAVLLRQCCGKVKDADSTWQKLGTHQAQLRGQLLQILEAEAVPQVRRKVSDCIQSLANQIVDIEDDQRPQNLQEWPELMPTLFRIICDTSQDSNLRADCLWIVKELTCSVWQMLLANPTQTYQVLQTCLADPALAVKAEAAALLCSFVDSISSREGRKPFQQLIPDVTTVMAQLASDPEPKHLNTVLQAFQSTTETADFFKQHIATHLMPVLCGIAKSHQDMAARKYAFEVIVSFMESKPKMMLKVPHYIEQALDLCVHFMMQLEDDISGWMQEDDEDGEDEELFSVGKEAVDRISRCAVKVEAFPFLLEGLKQAVTKLFQTGEWKQVVAGISTLAMIAEYVDDEATVSQMTNGIKIQLGASNARVRYAAWGGMAQFSEDHADVVSSEAFTSQLLPEFLKGLDDSCPRVSLRCMEAFQHYGEALEREDLEPFIQPLMEKLGAKLQSQDIKVQKKAITFIAVIAGQVDDAFAPYYGHLMPVLKQVIQNTLHKTEERQLLGKCFECISLLARAVGRSGFKADAEQIMQAMIEATKVPNLPMSDPVKEYMMAASERICSTLKEDFLPFVSHILPGVLEKFTLAPREFTPGNNDIDDDDEVNLTLLRENGQVKVMIMYSSEIQDLKGALECVHTFVEELAAAYAPFVTQTAQALLPVFDFTMEDGIRDLAFETWGQLCRSARQGGQVQIVSELVMEFLKRVLPKFEAAKVDISELKTSAEGVTSCLKEAGPNILHAEQLRHICRTTLAVMAESFKRREEAAKGRPNGLSQHDEDGDEHHDDDDEEEDEQAMRIALCEVAGSLMQHHADMFVAESFPDYLNLVVQWLQPQAPKDDRKLALFVMCDFLEYLGKRATPQWPQFLPKLIEDIHNPDAELRQPACFGVYLAAKVPEFAPLALDTAKRLSEVVTQSRQRSKKKSEKIAQACADNALSGLVEILMVHPQAVASVQGELWKVWLSGLPCQEDESEGERNHRRLLELIQQEKPEVVGEGGQNVPKLFGVLVDVYKTDMADEETSKGIGLFALRLGESKLEAFAAQFSEKQKKKLIRIVRE
ncbi:Importin-5 (Imp5) (Importin subunit beta-3) (Karyopherin beta-3) (Ran-binding protein 5) (RanBP5), partial [Durusdinium trenchii]